MFGWRCTLFLLLVASSGVGCGVLKQENHPTLTWLDERLPDPDSSAGSIALGAAILPIAIPAGLIDTFVANPVLQAPQAYDSTADLVWRDPEGSAFYQSAIFLPKVAITPLIFAFAWSAHIMAGE